MKTFSDHFRLVVHSFASSGPCRGVASLRLASIRLSVLNNEEFVFSGGLEGPAKLILVQRWQFTVVFSPFYARVVVHV